MAKIYESSVETIRETFAVLIGFAVTEFIGDRFKESGSADYGTWALSLALILLVLRLFIGTANHLKTTYAEIEVINHKRDDESAYKRFSFLIDVAFLIAFGIVSILIARSDPNVPESFINRTLLLLLITSLWPILEALREWIRRPQARGWWRWWMVCDASQLLFTVSVWRWGPRWPLQWVEVGLAFGFTVFFGFDVWMILRMRHSLALDQKGELLPKWYAYVGLAALLAAGVIHCWPGSPVWPVIQPPLPVPPAPGPV
jgi:hypothetical protein